MGSSLLNDYAKILAEYAAVIVTGQAVMGLASRGVDKSKIDYEAVKAYWLEEDKYGGSKWSNVVEEIFDLLGGEDADLDEVYSVKGWLSALIGQMAEEAVLKENVEVSTETAAEGTGYSITLSDIRKQVIDDIRVNLIAELPAVDKFLEDPENAQYAMRYMLTPEDLKIGSIKGTEIIDVDPETQGYRKTIEWLYEPISTWKVEQTEEKWYALKDTDGIVHVTAAIAEEDEIDIPLAYKTMEWIEDGDDEAGQQVKWNLVYLVYEPDQQGEWIPADLYFKQDSGFRKVPVSEYSGELEVWPAMVADSGGMIPYYVTISLNSIMLTADTVGRLEVEYMDISDIVPDIADTTADGKSFSTQIVVRNIYGTELDISDLLTRTSIKDAEVTGLEDVTYTGKAVTQSPVVSLGDVTLTEGTDFTVSYENNKNVGKATVTIKGIGEYSGKTVRTFSILPGASKQVRLKNVSSGMKVTWEKVEGATSYYVYRDDQLLFRTSKLEATDKEVKYNSGVKYTYKVVAAAKVDGVELMSPKARTSTYYRLMPVGIKSLTNPSAGKMTVTYDKNAKSSGYVVQFGLKSDMSDAKVITVKGAGTLSKTFSGLKKGKTYYVQVRTYKIEDGVRYYSAYCTTKKIKITK